MYKNAEAEAMKVLKPGDRVGCIECPGTKRVFTFSHFDDCWIVSKSGIRYNAVCVYSVNGKQFSVK